MKHYLAVLKNNTFQLIPINKEAVYILGYWDVEKQVLILQHSNTYQDYQFIAKINEIGAPVYTKDKQQVQRALLEIPYKFELPKEDAKWFINQYVINANITQEII